MSDSVKQTLKRHLDNDGDHDSVKAKKTELTTDDLNEPIPTNESDLPSITGDLREPIPTNESDLPSITGDLNEPTPTNESDLPSITGDTEGWSPRITGDTRCQTDPNLDREIRTMKSLGTLPSFPPSRFQHPMPVLFKEPLKLGEFSIDSQRRFHNDASAKKYFAYKDDGSKVSMDLKLGYDAFIKRDDAEKEWIDFVLKWVVENDADLSTTDFVCWRGLLTKLLVTPYENREGWIIAASRSGGRTIFMDDYDTEGRKFNKSRMTEEHKEMTFWGYKFEQYVTSAKKDGEPDLNSPVNNNEGYCRVVKSKLNEHSLIFAGEVDCFDECRQPPAYVELKTSRDYGRNQRLRDNFVKFKLLKFWAQSFLLGIPRITCGFRDDEGLVGRLEDFETLKIPHLARQVQDGWSGDVCLKFMSSFLKEVKLRVSSSDPRDVILFHFEPRRDIVIWECQRDSSYVFLPSWFIERQKN